MIPTRPRTLSALLLALVLAATSMTMAVARGQAQAGLPVVICSDGAVHTIYVDGDGQPVDRSHHCPYCILANGLLPTVAVDPAPLRVARPLFVLPAIAPVLPGNGGMPPPARGPPSSV